MAFAFRKAVTRSEADADATVTLGLAMVGDPGGWSRSIFEEPTSPSLCTTPTTPLHVVAYCIVDQPNLCRRLVCRCFFAAKCAHVTSRVTRAVRSTHSPTGPTLFPPSLPPPPLSPFLSRCKTGCLPACLPVCLPALPPADRSSATMPSPGRTLCSTKTARSATAICPSAASVFTTAPSGVIHCTPPPGPPPPPLQEAVPPPRLPQQERQPQQRRRRQDRTRRTRGARDGRCRSLPSPLPSTPRSRPRT